MKIRVTYSVEYELPAPTRAHELWAQWRAEYGLLAEEITQLLVAAGRDPAYARCWEVWRSQDAASQRILTSPLAESVGIRVWPCKYKRAMLPEPRYARGAEIRAAIEGLRRALELLRSAAIAGVLGPVMTRAYDTAVLRGGKWQLEHWCGTTIADE